ncbi:hypothetical protein D1872_329950 [compost metagenome]
MQFSQFDAEWGHREINFFQIVRQLSFPNQSLLQQFAGNFRDGAFRYTHIPGDIYPFNAFMPINNIQNVQG